MKTFSATGGIEKVCRIAGKAMKDYSNKSGNEFVLYSMHDPAGNNPAPYLDADTFRGFASAKIKFIVNSVRTGIKSRVVIISHINLLLPAYIIKILSPRTRFIVMAHGIEVWKPLSQAKKKMLRRMDRILPVSNYTNKTIQKLYDLQDEKCRVCNNCLDPFLPQPLEATSRSEYRGKYGIAQNDMVLMTLSRLSSKEKNKGYDKVLLSIKQLQPEYPHLRYLFVGKYEKEEKLRLDAVAKTLGLEDTLIFTGFVPDHEIAAYYNMADIYIMPSEKEGFGISFIEAMYYNKPVIAGNRDGSVDALLNGKLGILIDPQSKEEITNAIKKVIENMDDYLPDRKLLLQHFSYEVYRQNWENILNKLLLN